MRFIKAVVVGLIASLLFPASASALPAEQSVGFQFTFNPSLAITLSSDELVVSNLLPGNYASSNTITINVQTNNHSGYTLTAAVGDSEVPTLANSNLVNTTASEATFTSLASNANVTLANFTPNYWGYTTTQDLGDSSLYSGLTYGTATTLNQTVDPSGKSVNGYYGGNTTDFTIGVNAGADQVSGEYTNVISFAIVPNISTDFIIESLKYLQDFTELADDEMTSVINSMAAGQSYQLIDARDGEIYNLAKLADGKVWLQDNLALDLTDSTVLNNLTTSNTNASAASLTSLRSGNRSAGNQYATAGVANWVSGYSYSAPLIATSGTGNLGDWTKDTTQPLAMGQSGTGKIGVYYNYCAASAGSYCYGDGISEGTSSGNAIEDVCPASWRMPTGGASGEYQALYTAYSNSGADFVNALKLPLSGYFDSGSAGGQGSNGYFWSSTYYDSSSMYRLRVRSSGVYPQDYTNRNNGNSVRCLLDPATPYTIYYDKNTTDTVSDLPSTWNGTINTVRRPTLSTATPTRSNYNFIGWCDTLPTTSGDTDTCSGTTYTPGSELPASGNSSTVYAMWKAKYTITLALAGNATGITIDGTNYTTSATLTAGTYTISGSYASGYEFDSWATSGSVSVASTSSASTTMTVSGAGTLTLNGKQSMASIQSITPATCPTTATQVYDTRDNSVYYIQKLADDRCWLLDNLALDLTNSIVKANLSATNTNASDSTLGYLKNGGGTTLDKYAITGVAEWTSSPNYASSYSYSDPLVATNGTGYNGDWTKDTAAPLAMGQSGSGKIGIYYNYCAASAGSYCYGDGTDAGSPSGNATEDICPKGWRMPTRNEYSTARSYSKSGVAFVNALRTPLSGGFIYGSASSQGSDGNFWSSTMGTPQNMYVLAVNQSSDPDFSTSNWRPVGNAVRCILDPATLYTIHYDKNTTDTVSNLPPTENGTINTMHQPTLSTATPTRDNYIFIDWCTTRPITNNGIDSCPGTTYGPGSQYNIDTSQTESVSITLYAMWGSYSSIPTMQSIAASTCSTSPMMVRDSRDNEVYTIQKLADGKCWLLDNLRLDLSVTRNLTTANTNIVSDWTAPADIATWSRVYDAPKINTASKDTSQSYGSGSSRIGVYYNYCAATAGTYCYADGDGTGNATSDICPKGWRMPTGGSSGEYQALYTAYSSSATNFKNALHTPLSGYFYYDARDQGFYGYFWSSTYYSYSMYGLSVSSSNVSPQARADHRDGYSVRCVLQ